MSKKKKKSESGPKFRHDSSIGSAAAEDDERFLAECFLDTGYYETITQVEHPESIVLGRTGCGKSALIWEIERRQKNVRRIDPEDFSLRYIANSNVLKFFEEVGVKLDLFYQLLWKHVLCIELIKLRYKITDSEGVSSFMVKLSAFATGDRAKEAALQYFKEWADDDFWIETERRVKELIQKIEKQLSGGISIGTEEVGLGANALSNFSEQQIIEFRNHGQKVVDNVQMQSLHRVIDLLSDYSFPDGGEKYFIVIDDLDRDWAESRIRYKMIRALIESIKRLRRIKSAKFVVSLRVDLLEKVFIETRDSGFQVEKYEDLNTRIHWTEDELMALVDKRLQKLFRGRFQKSEEIKFYDVFPSEIKRVPGASYFVQRTHRRPRDLISFVNECLREASGKSQITPRVVSIAETRYSQSRLRSLYEEWGDNYPLIEAYTKFLVGESTATDLSKIAVVRVEEAIMEIACQPGALADPIGRLAFETADKGTIHSLNDCMEFVGELISILHKVGVIGVKADGSGAVAWTDQGASNIQPSDVTNATRFFVHPMFHRALSIKGQANEAA